MNTKIIALLVIVFLSACSEENNDSTSGTVIENDFLKIHDELQSINFSKGIFKLDFYEYNNQSISYSVVPKKMILVIDSMTFPNSDSDIWLHDLETRNVYKGALQSGITSGALSHLDSFGSYDISHGYLYPDNTGTIGFIGAHELNSVLNQMTNITQGIFRLSDTGLYTRISEITKLIGSWQDVDNPEFGVSTWVYTDALNGTLDVTMSSDNGCQGNGSVYPDITLNNAFSISIVVNTCSSSTKFEGIIYMSDLNTPDDTMNILLKGLIYIGTSPTPSSVNRASFSAKLQ